MSLPLVAVAALLHFPIAWLIQRLYRRTSFSEALDEYRKQINCKPFPGPDGTHPRNQGLQVLTLRGLWMHFESFSSHQQRFCRARVLTQLARFTLMLGSEWTDRDKVSSFCSRQQRTVRENTCPNLFNSGFILERNMHFVVANIVRPLTQSKRVSFVSLWGGRQVDYFVSLGMLLAKLFLNCFLPTFVHLLPKPLQASPAFWGRSHSWGTSFPHFVCSIQCHALSKEGPTSWIDAAYWICSFATWRRTLAHFHGGVCV